MEFLKWGTCLVFVVALYGCGKTGSNQAKGDEGNAPPSPVASSSQPSGDPRGAPATSTPAAGTETKAHSAEAKKTAAAPAAQDRSERLEGTFFTTEAQPLQLALFDKRPVIVMISAFGCQSCAEETRKLKEYFAKRLAGKIPGNVDMITILLNSVVEDAKDWQNSQGIPWLVGYQTDDQVITRYCKAMTTPCTVVRMPGQGVVFAQNGVAAPELLEHLTGGWH